MTRDDPSHGTPGGPMGHCPGCGSDRMLAVSNGFETNFLCEGCGRCWNVSFGRASLVDPLSCPGCGHEAVCRGRPVDEIAQDEVGDGRDGVRLTDGGLDTAATHP